MNHISDNILREEKIGWWQADLSREVFILSDFLKETLGVDENEITFDHFLSLVPLSYRQILSCDSLARSKEQTYPVMGAHGEMWFRWKVLQSEQTKDGVVLTGYTRQLSTPKEAEREFCAEDQMNNLLYRLNSISHTLLSFLHTDTVNNTIHQVLSDILKTFRGSRAYLTEFNWENRTHVYAYEVTDKGVNSGFESVDSLSMDATPWWIDQLSQGTPIIISTLDDLPPEAFREREVLADQGVCSLFVLPLMTREKLWGYVGIDVVDEPRIWQEEDYQWFSALANIVNLCIGLQRSERDAQTERDYLQNLYRYMPLGYIRLKMLYDRVGNPVNYVVLDSNYAAEEIIGKPQSEYVGHTAHELELDLLAYLPKLTEAFNADHHIEVDSYLKSNNKHIHAILYSTTHDEVICLLSDTSEIHDTHTALDRSEKLLRNIYDNIPVGIELYDKNGALIDINKKDMEIFGVRTKEDVQNINFFQNPVVPTDAKEQVRRGEEVSFKLYYPFDQVSGYYKTTKSGYVELYSSVSMLYDAQGELVNFMIVTIDNTEINRAHSRIAEFESSFSLVSRFGKVGYARFDLLTRQGYALPQWYHNLGEEEDIPMDQVIGVYTHVVPEDREELFALVRRIKAQEIESFSRDLRIQTDSGVKWTRVNVIRNPLNNDPSKLEMVCVNYDITALKHTEQSLIEAKNKAEVSDRLKSAFLANMSHEIRTPLNAIVGFSNLMMEADTEVERGEYMNIVQENNDLLLKLISDILDLSKIEAGTLEFNNAELDVNQMCLEIVRMLSIKIGNKPIELRLGDHLPECHIVSDKTRLTQVLSNFINNSLKFTKQGTITLGYRLSDEQTLTFYVEDTGTGISAKNLSSVFGRFVKLNAFAQGTGLGLAICKSIVEQLGGTIGVNSVEGQGACFWFTHPYVHATSAAEPLQPKEEEPPLPMVSDEQRASILIAEDTDSNYLLLSLMLKKEYTILRACNGEEAVQMCFELKPDLILMDIKMPVMDGLEATRCIRSEDQTIPVIAITAFAYDQDRQKALEAGCSDYLAKPIAGDMLKQKLRAWLKRE